MRETILPANKIILAMGMSEITHQTLRHELSKHINVSETFVQNIIQKGASGSTAHLIAHILKLDKYTPKNYDPFFKEVKHKPYKIISKLNLKRLRRNFAKKIPAKRWSQEEIAAIKLLLEGNTSHNEISDILNRNVTSVKAIIKRRLDN